LLPLIHAFGQNKLPPDIGVKANEIKVRDWLSGCPEWKSRSCDTEILSILPTLSLHTFSVPPPPFSSPTAPPHTLTVPPLLHPHSPHHPPASRYPFPSISRLFTLPLPPQLPSFCFTHCGPHNSLHPRLLPPRPYAILPPPPSLWPLLPPPRPLSHSLPIHLPHLPNYTPTPPPPPPHPRTSTPPASTPTPLYFHPLSTQPRTVPPTGPLFPVLPSSFRLSLSFSPRGRRRRARAENAMENEVDETMSSRIPLRPKPSRSYQTG